MTYQQAQTALLNNQKVYCILPIYKGSLTIFPIAIKRSKNRLLIKYVSTIVNVSLLRETNLGQEFYIEE